MTKSEVRDLMHSYGFSESVNCDGTGESFSIIFSDMDLVLADKVAPAVQVYGSGNFVVSVVIDNSINVLSSGSCSPITNHEHFMKIYEKVRIQGQVLRDYYRNN